MADYLRRLLAFRRAAMARHPGLARGHRLVVCALAVLWAVLVMHASDALAQSGPPPGSGIETPIPALPEAVPSVRPPEVPAPAGRGAAPAGTATRATADGATINIELPGAEGEAPTRSVLIIILLTLLSVAPSLIIMMTSFTRIVIVLSLTRNALGLPAIPPNQVVVGLALFLSLFVMAPTLSDMNDQALQPLLRGEVSQAEALSAASVPLREFMLANTRSSELQMLIDASSQDRPETTADVSLSTLIPAFLLSELKTAFIIGFVIFVPFVVIDLVVSSVLMALGMMMLPPAFVSLPFKLLLFVMVDGWSLVAESLVRSFRA